MRRQLLAPTLGGAAGDRARQTLPRIDRQDIIPLSMPPAPQASAAPDVMAAEKAAEKAEVQA
jgi:hypothetical protein